MTQHVTHLLNDWLACKVGQDIEAMQRAKAKLVAYIESLESKSVECDELVNAIDAVLAKVGRQTQPREH